MARPVRRRGRPGGAAQARGRHSGRSLEFTQLRPSSGVRPWSSQRWSSRRSSSSRGDVQKDRKVEQRRQPRPGLLVEQQVVAFGQHELHVARHDRRGGARQLDRAVEDRNGDVAIGGAQTLEQASRSHRNRTFRVRPCAASAPWRRGRRRHSGSRPSARSPRCLRAAGRPAPRQPSTCRTPGGPAIATINRLDLPACLKIAAATVAIPDISRVPCSSASRNDGATGACTIAAHRDLNHQPTLR